MNLRKTDIEEFGTDIAFDPEDDENKIKVIMDKTAPEKIRSVYSKAYAAKFDTTEEELTKQRTKRARIGPRSVAEGIRSVEDPALPVGDWTKFQVSHAFHFPAC